MKRILVTGADGYIGNAMVLALLNYTKQFVVRAAAQKEFVLNSKSFETVRLASLEDTPDCQKEFADCDALIHCETYETLRQGGDWLEESALHRIHVLGSVHLAREAYRAGIRRFIFISTVEVNGASTPEGKKFFADSLPRSRTLFGRYMHQTEKAIQQVGEESGLEVTIIRVPMVYGPGCSNLFSFARKLVEYCVPLPLLWCSKNKRSLLSIDNLTDFVIKSLVHPAAAGETFLVSDGHDLSAEEFFCLLAKSHRRPPLLWPFPPLFLRLFNSYIGRQAWEDFLFKNLVVDIKKNMILLGWEPPLSVEQCFRRSWDERSVAGTSHRSN